MVNAKVDLAMNELQANSIGAFFILLSDMEPSDNNKDILSKGGYCILIKISFTYANQRGK